jgi:hypothetical protein
MNSQIELNLSNNKINSIIKTNEEDSGTDSEENNEENNEELKLQLDELKLEEKKQIKPYKNDLYNYDMLELTKKLEQNFRKKHGNEHNYDRNLEFHIHDSINKFLKQDLKIKNTFNIFKPFKRLFSFKI